MALTVDFVTAVRRQGQLTAQVSDVDILAAGDIEVQGRFLPLLREAGAEYGVRRLSVPILDGRARVPDRSQVAGIRLVQCQAPGGRLELLPQVMPEDDVGAVASGPTPFGWYFDAGDICVVPASAQGSLLVRYYQRPSSMLLSSTAISTSAITSVVEAGPTITLVFGGGTGPAVNWDVVSSGPAHQVVVQGAVNGGGLGTATVPVSALTSADSARPVVGDWVAPAGRTPFVPLPEELFSALVHRTAGVMQQALGYLEESSAALAIAEETTQQALRMLTPRADGNPQAWTAGISRTLGQGRWWGW